MKLIAEPAGLSPKRFVIEHDENVGYYLYVFEGDRCVRDHLQDTLDLAVEQAFHEFQVPKDSWKLID